MIWWIAGIVLAFVGGFAVGLSIGVGAGEEIANQEHVRREP